MKMMTALVTEMPTGTETLLSLAGIMMVNKMEKQCFVLHKNLFFPAICSSTYTFIYLIYIHIHPIKKFVKTNLLFRVKK